MSSRNLLLTFDGVGKAVTLDKERPEATAILIEGSRIAKVGSQDELETVLPSGSTRLNLNRAFAYPGLVDSHGHIRSLGQSMKTVRLDNMHSYDEVVEHVKERSQEIPKGAWIQGRNWNQENWGTRDFPTHGLLSMEVPDHPVWLTRVDGHAGIANSKAMEIAGVTDSTPSPNGGMVGSKDGKLTGLFLDVAMSLIRASIPPITVGQAKSMILDAQEACLRAGLTEVHDAGIGLTELKAYQELVSEGRLKLRVYAMQDKASFDREPWEISPSSPNDRLFTCRSLKIIYDGALGSRGAAMFEEYSDSPGESGFTLISEEHLTETISRAMAVGFQVNIHAIGDRANHEALNAIERAIKEYPGSDHRSRIEHAQNIASTDIMRFKELGVIASVQPTHCTSDMLMAERRLGEARLGAAYPWRILLDNAIRVVSGSDFPVESEKPMWGIYSAVTRQTHLQYPNGGWQPQQRMTVNEALQSFTTEAAFARFMESEKGMIKEGMLSDMTILDRDIRGISPEEILSVEVLATIVNGELVYQSF